MLAGRGRRVWRWLLRAFAVAVVAALAVYLYAVGLDQADKLGSALSLLIAVAALLSPWSFRRSEQAEAGAAAKPVEPGKRTSAYLEDVRQQFEPPQLLDRETELAQLAEFCARDEPAYWRWVAEAWSGKSALLAWFVLHPPAKVDVVAFFITSRFNPHNNRDAFFEAVTEQLDALLGTQPSPVRPVSARSRHLHLQLVEAAAACHRAGHRLVLVVDGLDEDRGVHTDSEIYTIAGLLPREVVPGLKVIVAGRPHPPLPDEIEPGHPLRQAASIHRLLPSAHAKANQQAAGLELRRLLRDDLGRPVLGLLTTAGGGLTVNDLATLTGRAKYDVSQLLRSSVGRTFVTRPGRWRDGPEFETYGLAHEELRRETLRSLDTAEVEAHQQSIVDWAVQVAAAGWPADTAEYLLLGYPGFLTELEDVDGVVKLATDDARHDRMRAISGGDHANLLEIAAAAERLLADSPPELGALAHLAFHRGQIEARTSELPYELPVLWAKLGSVHKAEAMAWGYSIPRYRELAVAGLLQELAAQRHVPGLERFVRMATDPDQLLSAYAVLLDVAITTGDAERVELRRRQALELLPSARTADSVMRVAGPLARIGEDSAEQAQRLVGEPYLATAMLVARSQAASEAGDLRLADRLALRAERIVDQLSGVDRSNVVRELTGTPIVAADRERRERLLDKEIPAEPLDGTAVERVHRLAEVVRWQFQAGRLETAARLADRAVTAMREVPPSPEYWDCRHAVCGALGLLGQVDLALGLIEEVRAWFDLEETDRSIRNLREELARGLADAGYHESVDLVLAGQVGAFDRQSLMAELAEAAARRGDVDRARSLIDQLDAGPDRVKSLAALAEALVVDGDPQAVLSVVEEGVRIAPETREPPWHSLFSDGWLDAAVVTLAVATADAGRPDRAAELAEWVESRAVGRDYPTSTAVEALTAGLISAGDIPRAERLIEVEPVSHRVGLRRRLIDQLLSQGEDREAEALARRAEPSVDGTALVAVVRHRGEAGAALAEELLRPPAAGESVHFDNDHQRISTVRALAEGGGRRAAERLADLVSPYYREWATTVLCLAAVEAGDDESVERLFAKVHGSDSQIRIIGRRLTMLGEGPRDLGSDLLRQAESALGQLSEPRDRVWAILKIAAGATAAGFLDRAAGYLREAKVLADGVADPDDRDDALQWLIEGLPLTQDVEEVLAVVAQISDHWGQEAALTSVAKASAAAGDLRRAVVLMEAAPSANGQVRAAADVAEAVARRGDYRAAATLGERTADEPEDRARVLRAVVTAAVNAEDLSFAEATLARVMDDVTNGRDQERYSRWNQVRVAAAEGWCELAAAARDSAGDQSERWIAEALAIADELQVPEDRAAVLLRCAAVVPEPTALRLVGRAFAEGPWHLPLAELVQYDAEALAELADLVLEQSAGRSFRAF